MGSKLFGRSFFPKQISKLVVSPRGVQSRRRKHFALWFTWVLPSQEETLLRESVGANSFGTKLRSLLREIIYSSVKTFDAYASVGEGSRRSGKRYLSTRFKLNLGTKNIQFQLKTQGLPFSVKRVTPPGIDANSFEPHLVREPLREFVCTTIFEPHWRRRTIWDGEQVILVQNARDAPLGETRQLFEKRSHHWSQDRLEIYWGAPHYNQAPRQELVGVTNLEPNPFRGKGHFDQKLTEESPHRETVPFMVVKRKETPLLKTVLLTGLEPYPSR